MYDELVIRCRDNGMKLCGHMQTDFWDAADAIHTLSHHADDWEKIADGWRKRCKEAEEKIPRWIPVTERLPEKNTWVLAYCKYKDHVIDYVDTNGLWSYGNVTHWMPLPSAPAEE